MPRPRVTACTFRRFRYNSAPVYRRSLAGLALCALLLAPAGARAQHGAALWAGGQGKPAVIGAYISLGYWNAGDVEATFARLSALGVNLVIDYALTAPEDEGWEGAFQSYMDTAGAHGVGVAFCLFPLLDGMNPREPGERMQRVAQTVQRLKRYSGITAWYVHDEILPSIAGDAGTKHYTITLEQMQALYRSIHAADPARPQLCVWNFLPPHELFSQVYKDSATPYGRPSWMLREKSYERALERMVQTTCDWVLVDCYPVGAPWRDASSPPPERDVAVLVARTCRLKREDQPLLFVFQAFSWAQYEPGQCAGQPFPTLPEMAGMLGAAAQSGATGAVAYSWFDLAKDLPNHDVPGRAPALDNLAAVLGSLSRDGWPPAPGSAAAPGS